MLVPIHFEEGGTIILAQKSGQQRFVGDGILHVRRFSLHREILKERGESRDQR